jgi:hypothetical protein
MLVAMAITLVMMAAVVTLFANVSNSVRNRRATIEMSGQLRHVRNVLQQDLQGATCPGLTWQRPESNHGYIEIIEGQYRDSAPSMLTDGVNTPTGTPPNPELNYEQSLVPRANDGSLVQFDPPGDVNGTVISRVNGLGDYDDILMLTVRNEEEPFVGRAPINVRQPRNQGSALRFDVNDSTAAWAHQTVESPLAEVVWFAIENPDEENDANGFFGEPGMRTIYRRTLLVAPWLNPYRFVEPDGAVRDTFTDDGSTFKAEPGLVRLLRDDVEKDDVSRALAALVAFQDRYDLSVRLEWDHNIGNDGRWKIMANTLGDLTKRENRFAHAGYHYAPGGGGASSRVFPYAAVSTGSGYSGSPTVTFVVDPEITAPSDTARATANLVNAPAPLGQVVQSYTGETANLDDINRRYSVRPFAFVADDNQTSATARAILNDDGAVARVVQGFAPLWGTRRGEDVMMTDALAFDLQVFDPGAPLYGVREIPGDPTSEIATILEPSDAGWQRAYLPALGSASTGFEFSGQGAYVDMGYSFGGGSPTVPAGTAWSWPWFADARGLSDVFGNLMAPGYTVYDTWSYHYENNGRDDDGDEIENGIWQRNDGDAAGSPLVDEGINGLDDIGHYSDGNAVRLGIDDVGERETAPPYDKPLRGMQAMVRVYERDSRAIRQVRVNQHFMPE